MTIEQKLTKYLEGNGMFAEDAAATMELIKADGTLRKEMAHRWNDDTEGYPAPMMGILMLTANRYALLWIDKHCPEAWYRSMFTGDV